MADFIPGALLPELKALEPSHDDDLASELREPSQGRRDEQPSLSVDLHLDALKARAPDADLGSEYGLIVATGGKSPPFEFEGATLYKRVTLVFESGRIAKVFYPVFPPDRDAEEVLAWLGS